MCVGSGLPCLESPNAFSISFTYSTFQNAKTAKFSPETDVLNVSGNKARVASKGLSKGPLFAGARGDSDDEDNDEDGMWDRQYVKLQSVRNLKMEQKRQARQLKLEGVVGIV
jgi:hypothetical protein